MSERIDEQVAERIHVGDQIEDDSVVVVYDARRFLGTCVWDQVHKGCAQTAHAKNLCKFSLSRHPGLLLCVESRLLTNDLKFREIFLILIR